MKHLKRVLSVILTAAMLLTMVPFAVSAAATDYTYDISLFAWDFEDTSTSIKDAGFGYKETTYVTVELAADPAADGAHGTAVKIAKSESTSEAASGSNDSYFRIDYETGDNITTRFANAPEVLAKVKASMDVYMLDDFQGFNIRFYDKTSGTTKGDNLATVSRTTDAEGNVKARVGFMNGGAVVIDVNAWYTFEFYVDAANGTYSAAINGEEKATDCVITDTDRNGTIIDTCVAAFGIQKAGTDAAYTIYLDNIKFEIPKDSIIPQNTNTVWENDFDDVELISGSTVKDAPDENADIDYKPQYADWEIKEEADGNRYYYFQPQSTSFSNTNSGNREDGYFKVSNTDVRVEDENGKYITGLDAASSWDETPYGIDTFKIDKLRLDFSIKVNKLMETQVCSYYRGTMYGNFASANRLFHLHSDGTVGIGTQNNIVATYEAGQWIDVSMYINYADHYAAYFMNDQYLGITSLSITLSHFNQIRFRIDKATTETYSDYGVSVDNIRYSTPYSEAYINRNPYTTEIAKVDYKDVEAGTVLNKTTDPSKYQFSTDAVSGTVVYDEEKGHNVLFYDKSAGQGTGAGVPAAAAQTSDVYKKYNKYPDVVRVETEVKRAVATATYVHIQGKEIMMHGGSSKIQFKNGETRVATTVDPGQNTWYTVAFDLDFVSGTYDAYYDGTLLAEDYTIPTGITAPENIVVSSNSVQNNAYINYISVGALPPYGADSLCEYLDENADWKIGYALNNDSSDAATHKLLIAKFNADGTLDTVTISDQTVAAGAYSICSTPLTEAADGGYYKYFVWENLDSIKPLLSNEIIK